MSSACGGALALFAAAVVAFAGCEAFDISSPPGPDALVEAPAAASPTATAPPSASPVPAPSATSSPDPTSPSTATLTALPSASTAAPPATATATGTPEPTRTPRPTQTPWPTPVVTPGASPTPTPLPIPRPPPLPEDMPTATPTPGCPIPVLEAEPTEPFDVLAILEVDAQRSPRSRAAAVSAAQIRACALGGDAIVVLYAEPADPYPVPGIPPRRGVLVSPTISVAVIRYRAR